MIYGNNLGSGLQVEIDRGKCNDFEDEYREIVFFAAGPARCNLYQFVPHLILHILVISNVFTQRG